MYSKTSVISFLSFGLLLAALFVYAFDGPAHRTWAPQEVPVAFWAWRNNTPGKEDIERVVEATSASNLFLRAGQIDDVGGSLLRIREPFGQVPAGIDVHLVYNGTRDLLDRWSKHRETDIAASLAAIFNSDREEAERYGSSIVGIQLDLDIPTRLLPSYAVVTAELRRILPVGTKLSITGLPTWLGADALKNVLANTDFWIPQCYGLQYPKRTEERVPVSSAKDVAKIILAVRDLGSPFYAGLSAYGYAMHFSKTGEVLELRGDLVPGQIASRNGFELISKDVGPESETRYVYRAKEDAVVDGIVMKPGEILVFETPSLASLRSTARAVRTNAGEHLRGISIFRIPTNADIATLTTQEIAAALRDEPPTSQISATVSRTKTDMYRLSIRNTGTARSIVGDEAVSVDMSIRPGSIKTIEIEGGDFAGYVWRCAHPSGSEPLPCSSKRANILRFFGRTWIPGSEAKIRIRAEELPTTFVTSVNLNTAEIKRHETPPSVISSEQNNEVEE